MRGKAPSGDVWGIREILIFLWRGWVLLILGLVVGMAGGAVAAKALQGAPTYYANVCFDISYETQPQGEDRNPWMDSRAIVAYINSGRHPMQQQIQQETQTRFTAEAYGEKAYIYLRADAASAQAARTVLKMFEDGYRQIIQEQWPEDILTLNEEYGVQETCVVPPLHLPLYMGLGAVVGLLLGCFAALLLAILRNTYSTAQEVQQSLSTDVLAEIPHLNMRNSEVYMESFRFLREALLTRCAQPSIVTLCGAHTGAGCDMVVSGLAAACAQNGWRTLVLDFQEKTHSDEPTQSMQQFAQDRDAWDALEADADGAVRVTLCDEPQVLAAFLDAPEAKDWATSLHTHFACVLFAAPNAAQTSLALPLGRLSDGVVLVLRSGKTGADSAVRAMDNLRRGCVNLLGAVLNDTAAR